MVCWLLLPPLPFCPLLLPDLLKIRNLQLPLTIPLPKHSPPIPFRQAAPILVEATEPAQEFGHVGVVEVAFGEEGGGEGEAGGFLDPVPFCEFFLFFVCVSKKGR